MNPFLPEAGIRVTKRSCVKMWSATWRRYRIKTLAVGWWRSSPPMPAIGIPGRWRLMPTNFCRQQKFATVVVIAPSHYATFTGVAIYDQGGMRTPLGTMALDRDYGS